MGQTISAPHMVAIMCDLLDIQDGMKFLRSGGVRDTMPRNGNAGRLRHVYTVERIEALALFARDNLKKANVKNVTVIVEDGSLGLPGFAPYDRISVAAASPEILDTLTDQLKTGGKLVIPVANITRAIPCNKTDGIKKKLKGALYSCPCWKKRFFLEFLYGVKLAGMDFLNQLIPLALLYLTIFVSSPINTSSPTVSTAGQQLLSQI